MKNILEQIKNNEKLMEFISANKAMFIKVAAAAAVVVVAFLFFAFKGNDSNEIVMEETEVIETEAEESEINMLFVDICGEVNEPKLVQLPQGSRIEDAIDAAGGLTADADIDAINRAAFVNDGEKIYIPSVEEQTDTERITASESTTKPSTDISYYGNKVNINTADLSELQELNGIGPVTAGKIIEYRETNGRFSSIEEIKNVSGIGDRTFDKLKDDITV